MIQRATALLAVWGLLAAGCARPGAKPGADRAAQGPTAAPASAAVVVEPSIPVPDLPKELSAASAPAATVPGPGADRAPMAPDAAGSSEVLAEVNGEAISLAEFALGYPAYVKSLGSPPDSAELRMAYLDSLVTERLLEQETRRRKLDGDPEYALRLAEAKRQVAEEALLKQALGNRLRVSDPEIAQYYEAHKDAYVEPKLIQVRNITTYTREAAQKARERILAGEDFRTVAAEVSTHPSRAEGGALPPFARGTYNSAFEGVAFALKIGELSEVFQTDLGCHVIEKTGETPGRVVPLAQAREEIRARLEAQKRTEALEELNRLVRESAAIRVLRNP